MGDGSESGVSGKDFGALLDQLRIVSIRLESSQSKCVMWEPPGEGKQFKVRPFFKSGGYDQIADKTGLVAIAETGVDFLTENEEVAAFVDANFFVVYGTPTRPNEEVVEYFLDSHLRLHVWPYVREFVQNTVGRFGWEQYALPPQLITQDLRPPRREKDSATAETKNE